MCIHVMKWEKNQWIGSKQGFRKGNEDYNVMYSSGTAPEPVVYNGQLVPTRWINWSLSRGG